jgi:hypothetical protein
MLETSSFSQAVNWHAVIHPDWELLASLLLNTVIDSGAQVLDVLTVGAIIKPDPV